MQFNLFKNYPQGYTTVFFVKLLGNFSCYGLKSVLVLFLTSQLLFSDTKAFSLYGTFMTLVHLMPVLGGWFCDQVFGIRKSVLIGGILAFVGLILVGFTQELIYLSGLSLVSVGIGLFKPSTSSAVGNLFPEPTKRDRPYTTLYVGINLGNFLSLLVCGWIGQLYGWKSVFPIIGIAIFLGSWIFYKTFKDNISLNNSFTFKNWKLLIFYGGIGLSVAFVFGILVYESQIYWLIPVLILVNLGCLGPIFIKSKAQERQNVLQIGLLMILFAIFYSILEQIGSSMMLFIERGVNRTFFETWTVSTLFFQSLNPVFVVALGPCIAGLWNRRENKGIPTGLFGKFALGFFFISLSFLILGLRIRSASPNLVSPFWIMLVFLCQVLGELFIIPIGLSAVSKLAPKKFSVMIMGIWMLTHSCGHYIGAILAKFSSMPQNNSTSLVPSSETYQWFFIRIAAIPFIVSLAIVIGIIFVKVFSKSEKIT